MPNTFVHLGVQTLASRAVLKTADFKWIAVGCIIPDFPWIMQRIFLAVNPGTDQYALLDYFSAQASLFCALLLCGALALVTINSGRLFLLLAGNSILHLLLDAAQIKWANGVHLFAPFSWHLTGFDLIWPEHSIVYLLTILGVLVLLYYGWRDRLKPVVLAPGKMRSLAAVLLIVLYLAVPFLFSRQLYRADNHYTATLRETGERSGRYLELDRAPYRSADHTVRIFNGERLRVRGNVPAHDAIISVQGYFTDTGTIHVSAVHVHSPVRDFSSIIALAGVLFVWLSAVMNKRVVFSDRLSKI